MCEKVKKKEIKRIDLLNNAVWALGGLLCHELEIYSRRFGACRRYPAVDFHVVRHVSSPILPPLFPAVPSALLMRQQGVNGGMEHGSGWGD